jgi:hypothetical protein
MDVAENADLAVGKRVVMSLLASCRYGQHQLCDPEGNLLDVFE